MINDLKIANSMKMNNKENLFMKKTKHTRKFKFVQFKQHREIVTPNKLALALREIEPTNRGIPLSGEKQREIS